MNKKFIKISFGILTSVFFIVLAFKVILKDKVLLIQSTDYLFENARPTIEYKDFEEKEDLYKIIISIKNNTEYYTSINEIFLQFECKMPNSSLYFRGYDLEERKFFENYSGKSDEDFSPYLAPYEERKYAFEISKGLTFDEDVFDTNKMNISYNINYYKYRFSSNTLFGGVMSHGGGEHIDNQNKPFIIE